MIAAEALVAITGLWPTSAPSRSTVLAASNIVKSWSRKFSTFLDGKVGKFKWKQPPDAESLHNDILEEMDSEKIAGWFTNMLDAELAIEYVAVIKRGREYLANIWPKLKIQGIVAKALPPSRDQLDSVWTIARTLDDLDVIFDDLNAHCLAKEQVVAFREIYPELSAMSDRMVEDLISGKIAKGDDLSWEVESQIKTLMGLPQIAPIVVQTPKQTEPEPTKEATIDFKQYETPMEKRRL